MTPAENRRRLTLLRAEEAEGALDPRNERWLGTCPALGAIAKPIYDTAARQAAQLRKQEVRAA